MKRAMQVVSVYLQKFRSKIHFEMCVAERNSKNSLKPCKLRVDSRLRSSMSVAPEAYLHMNT